MTVVGVRPAAVAGRFYPADPEELRASVHGHLAAAGPPDGPAPKALIAPHAGYVYSGGVAGRAWAAVAPSRGVVTRVVLAGPAHFVPVRVAAVPGVDAFSTPLGPVRVDDDARQVALDVAGVVVDDAAHAPEHSLEVHLPFLIETLGDVAVLPIVVGRTPAEDVARIFDALWDGDETLIVASSDLSHYHDDHTARALDRETADLIVAGRFGDLEGERACGAAPVAGLLAAATRRGLSIRLLDLRTSADTIGPPDRVVGYGAFVVA